jgi:hypothetical protein
LKVKLKVKEKVTDRPSQAVKLRDGGSWKLFRNAFFGFFATQGEDSKCDLLAGEQFCCGQWQVYHHLCSLCTPEVTLSKNITFYTKSVRIGGQRGTAILV